MRYNFKKAIGMTLAAVMAVSMMGAMPATAEEVYPFEDFLESYFENSLPNCLYEYGYSENDDYYVSYPVEYSNYLSDEAIGYYVFVFENDSIIGKLRTYTYGDNQYVVFDESIPAEVQTMYDNGEDIAITVDEDYTFVVSETDSVALDVDDDVKMDKPVELSASIEKAREVYVSNPDYARSASLGHYTISGIKFVGNETAYGYAKPVLCWEACLAMKANLLNGTNLMARDVYNYIGCPDPYSISSTVVDDTYRHYGMNVTYYKTTRPTSELLAELRKNNAIELGVTDSSKGINHAILLYGLYVYDDQTTFYLIDPDFISAKGLATVTVSGNPIAVQDNLVYTTAYQTRDDSEQNNYKWKRTRY